MAEPGFPRWAAAVLGLVVLVAPLVAPNDYWIGVMARICLYATLALGLNIVVGFALSRNTHYYYLFLAALALTLLASARLRHSRIGWAWQAIREDELAARAMGINTTVAKLQAFAIGASFAGIGGSFLASWQRSVFPENFLFTESINILAMVILGGMGNLLGVVAGAALLVSIPEVFRDLQRYRLLVFGLMLMVLMVFRPQGLLTFRDRREAEPELAGDQEPAAGG